MSKPIFLFSQSLSLNGVVCPFSGPLIGMPGERVRTCKVQKVRCM